MSASPGSPRDRRTHPLIWRLPLVLMLIVGLVTLVRLDRLLVRDYRKDAQSQALQIDALLESFLQQRIVLLGSLRAIYVSTPSQLQGAKRFDALVGEIVHDAPDLFTVFLLDTEGNVVDTYRRGGSDLEETPTNHLAMPERAPALRTVFRERRPAVTGAVRLRDGTAAMIAYVPIVRDGDVTGAIGGALAYQALFHDALAGQLRGRFAYRLRDQTGELIAISPSYPEQPSALITRDVMLSDSRRWVLDVAIPAFQPLTPRLITWLAGVVFLALVTVFVLREEARGRRFAAYSHELEILSRNLLDANVRLEERSRQIAEANRAKSRFLANVSHELRTPLNAIVGYNSLALDGVYGSLPPALATAHDRIRAAAEHLLGLVNDVLDLSKIEVGRMELELEPVELESVIDSVATVTERIAEAKGLRLDVVVSRDLPTLTTDARHLRQIVMNLVSNAIKFTDRGSVTLVARRAEGNPSGAVEVVVRDTGIGIPTSDLERIFEEFEQVRPSGRGDSIQRGTGLGLTIARKLARLLGGEITVESNIGSGSRFKLELPVSAPSSPQVLTPPEGRPALDQVFADGKARDRGATTPPRPQEDSGEKAIIGREEQDAGLDVDHPYQ